MASSGAVQVFIICVSTIRRRRIAGLLSHRPKHSYSMFGIDGSFDGLVPLCQFYLQRLHLHQLQHSRSCTSNDVQCLQHFSSSKCKSTHIFVGSHAMFSMSCAIGTLSPKTSTSPVFHFAYSRLSLEHQTISPPCVPCFYASLSRFW